MLNQVKDLAEYEVDAIFFCTKSSHTPQNMSDVPRNTYAAYNPPIVEKYRKKYGVNILNEKPDKDKVARIHGEYLVDFLVKARKILNEKNIELIAGATLNGYLQPSGKNIYLDWRDILTYKAADALTMSNTRGETFVWYEEETSEKLKEIAHEVKKEGMKFYAYILSTVFWEKLNNSSTADMLEFISEQMAYFSQMNTDGVLIHEVYQKEIWDVLGNWEINQSVRPNPEKAVIPSIQDYPYIFDKRVPVGDFEEEKSYWFWDVIPGWLSVDDWLPEMNEATGLNPQNFEELWSKDTG